GAAHLRQRAAFRVVARGEGSAGAVLARFGRHAVGVMHARDADASRRVAEQASIAAFLVRLTGSRRAARTAGTARGPPSPPTRIAALKRGPGAAADLARDNEAKTENHWPEETCGMPRFHVRPGAPRSLLPRSSRRKQERPLNRGAPPSGRPRRASPC